MISISKLYNIVALDQIKTSQNGDLSFDQFNRMSELSELNLLDWLTGSVIDSAPPILYSNQKVKDWASPFLTSVPLNIQNGGIVKPDDYYLYDSMYVINSSIQADCVTGKQIKENKANSPIELLDTQVFDDRVNTYVPRLKPSIKKPIAKIVGTNYEFEPHDLGSIRLLYYRYPVFAKIVTKIDPLYNNEVIDEARSINYEWPLFASKPLSWFITNAFADSIRESALKQFNTATGKTPAAAKSPIG